MQKVVGVKFSGGKVYTFNANSLEPQINDNVIAETSLGLSYGVVATPIREIETPNEDLKNIIRIATPQDKKKFEELKKRAEKDLPVIKEKVKKLDLAMKIVSAEYTFDASKIIIEFAADDRVDFRELLKELASALHVRIELHQVGQRDEVKLKGGIGPCGEICCCVRFLKDFEHVTVKMAKNQGLSLSPTKISGLCGRLMCCLGYENEMYEDILKRMPKVNQEVSTPKGRGTVVYNDILRERVNVKIKSNDDSFTIYDFSLDELGVNNEKREKEPETKAFKPKENKDKNQMKNNRKKEENKDGISNN